MIRIQQFIGVFALNYFCLSLTIEILFYIKHLVFSMTNENMTIDTKVYLIYSLHISNQA